MWSFAPLLFLLLIDVVFGFYDHTDAVTELTDATFVSEVFGSPDVWLVEFYAPWCGHCRNLAPAYLKAAENVKGLVRMGAVNCDEHKQACGSYGIRGFPTLKIFAHDADPRKGEAAATDYTGPRTAAAIARGVLDALPNKVTKIAAEKTQEKFFEKPLGKVLLFTDKPAVSNLYKALAVQFDGRLAFAQVQPAKMKELAEQYSVTGSPTLVVVPAADGAEPVKYEDKMKHAALHKFLEQYSGPAPENQYAGGAANNSNKKKKEDKPKGPPPPPPQDAVWRLQTGAKLQEALERPGIVAVALLDSYADEADRQAQLTVLDELLAKQSGAHGGFTITWLDPLDQDKWMQPFGFGQLAASDLPRLMILNQKRGYFNAYVGPFTTDAIFDYFTSVKRGGVKVQPLPKDLDLIKTFTDAKSTDKTEL